MLYTDPDVELLQMQARCYSPEMKRFISADPTGLGGGVNFYTYADGNPLNSIDPEGLCARPSLFGRTSQFGVRSANFGGFSQVGRTPGIASSYSSFGRPASKPFDFESLRSVGPALYKALVTVTGIQLISDAIYGYSNMGDPSKERILSTHQRISSGVIGTLQFASSLASIVEVGGASAMAGTLRSEVSASRAVVANRADDFVVSFMGKNGAKYYNSPSATLGAKGGTVWVSPLDDVAGISTRSGVVTGTGHAPGPLQSYLKGEPIYGIAVPKNSVSLRTPTITDAGVNRHFRLGGATGVEHNGVWKSSNIREFILDGGSPVPKGSVFFEFGPNGSWIPIRRY